MKDVYAKVRGGWMFWSCPLCGNKKAADINLANGFLFNGS